MDNIGPSSLADGWAGAQRVEAARGAACCHSHVSESWFTRRWCLKCWSSLGPVTSATSHACRRKMCVRERWREHGVGVGGGGEEPFTEALTLLKQMVAIKGTCTSYWIYLTTVEKLFSFYILVKTFWCNKGNLCACNVSVTNIKRCRKG